MKNKMKNKKRKTNKIKIEKCFNAGDIRCSLYLENGQQALIETVKVSSWLFCQRVIVKSCAENLHPQQSKDAHEQKQKKQK